MKVKKIAIAATVCALCIGGAAVAGCAGNSDPVKMNADKASIVVTGYEWGPAVNSVVVKFKEKVSGVTKDTFTVTTAGKKRTVTNAYCSDANGKKSTADSEYVTLELAMPKVTAWGADATPFAYSQETGRNDWASTYNVKLTVAENQKLTVGKTKYKAKDFFSYDVTSAADRLVPQTATWNKDSYQYNGEGKHITLSRAAWTPEGAAADGVKNPLIIWLHGGGEGGTDIDIALLGNEVTALTSENETNVQSYFKTGSSAGAYVLAVQSPTMWMDADGDGSYGNSQAGDTVSGEPQLSYYTEALFGAISSYVAGNSDIDTDRIYIGGCSNGGYMTVELALKHGDYFAAYYPICEGYKSGNMSDDMINSLKDLNMWFVLSEADNTLKPSVYSLPLYYRLLQAGADNCYMTLFENVTGKDVAGNVYDGHWSWIYAFNDEVKTRIDISKINSQNDLKHENCTVEGNMWQWLAAQTREQAPAEPVETYEFEAENAVITNGKTMGMTGWDGETNQPIYGEVDVKPTVESAKEYAAEGTGADVTSVGYFSGTGTAMEWEITAEEECEVTLTLRAASAVQIANEYNQMIGMTEIDLSQGAYVKLFVNDEEKTLTGTLPGLTQEQLKGETVSSQWGDYFQPDGSNYHNYGTGTVTICLNKGKNVIKLATQSTQGGINVDKIVISGTEVKLSYVPANNSDRIPQQQPQG